LEEKGYDWLKNESLVKSRNAKFVMSKINMFEDINAAKAENLINYLNQRGFKRNNRLD